MAVRPIDANALREEIMTENYDNDTINNFLDLVDFAPTFDYEPVVHCRDCKHLLKRKMLCWHKTNRVFSLGKPVHNNHFCSYGAKMDEEVKD